jgi:DNA-binding Xre family transcriptional regulator
MITLRVRELAEEQGMSKSLLQRRSGVTMPTLKLYWDNKMQSIHLVSIERLARALGVEPLDLLNVQREEKTND